jgi:hypothetical protein
MNGNANRRSIGGKKEGKGNVTLTHIYIGNFFSLRVIEELFLSSLHNPTRVSALGI